MARDQWALVDFEGNEFPLVAPGDQEVTAATFSPDGKYVGFVSIERLDERKVEFHVAEVSTVLSGAGVLGSLSLDFEPAGVLFGGSNSDPRIMRWTTDNRVLIAPTTRDAAVIEIGLSGS